jgi:hypothetical protein
MGIEPDTADWTWVLERACPECGLDVATLQRAEVGDEVRRLTGEWVAVLERPDVAVRTRPDRWSPLEYGCHVRDVFEVYDRRLARMLAEDGPHYENWDQDATAVAERYSEQDPSTVAAALSDAGGRLARRFDTVSGDDWDRTGFRGDGASFTVDSFARYFLHDPVHHLHDVGGVSG